VNDAKLQACKPASNVRDAWNTGRLPALSVVRSCVSSAPHALLAEPFLWDAVITTCGPDENEI
jgi:hypothetical protein